MYNPDSLVEALVRHPFRPFTIELDSGERIEVNHPEAAIVTTSDDVVVIDRREDGRASLRYIGLDHVRSFQDV